MVVDVGMRRCWGKSVCCELTCFCASGAPVSACVRPPSCSSCSSCSSSSSCSSPPWWGCGCGSAWSRCCHGWGRGRRPCAWRLPPGRVPWWLRCVPWSLPGGVFACVCVCVCTGAETGENCLWPVYTQHKHTCVRAYMYIVGVVYLRSVATAVVLAHWGCGCCVGLWCCWVIGGSGVSCVLTRVGVPVYIHVHGAHTCPYAQPSVRTYKVGH